MNIWVCGINFRTAPLSFRELLCVSDVDCGKMMREMRKRFSFIEEICLLSTCNRTEFYVYAEKDMGSGLVSWLATYFQVEEKPVQSSLYVYRGKEAVKHLMRVASGMDSMVLGETQIFSQVKKAYQRAVQEEMVGSAFRVLFPYVFRGAKQVRSCTEIGVRPVSLASVGIRIAGQVFSQLSACRVMLVGAGQMMADVGGHLSGSSVEKIYIANRSFQGAHALSEKVGATPIGLTEVSHYLHEVDILFSATSSVLPVLGKGAVESALQLRKRKPMVMMDLGLPRDIEPEIGTIQDVYLYDLDTLCATVKKNQSIREEALDAAEHIVAAQSQSCMESMALRKVAHLITHKREKMKERQNRALEEAVLALRQGEEGEQVIRTLCHQLGKTLLHDVTLLLKSVTALEEESRSMVLDILHQNGSTEDSV